MDGGCYNCLDTPAGIMDYFRIVKEAKVYVKEKKVSVAILKSPEGYSLSESFTGPVFEILLYDPHAST